MSELRDLETIFALPAETGIQVLATSTPTGPPAGWTRIINVFPAAARSRSGPCLGEPPPLLSQQGSCRQIDGRGGSSSPTSSVNTHPGGDHPLRTEPQAESVIQAGGRVGSAELDAALRSWCARSG